MFYGLNNFIRKILPKRLFYRSLIIVVTPIILLQIIITIVFFDSLWIKANKGMTRSLVGEVQTMFDIYKQGDENYQQMIINLYGTNKKHATHIPFPVALHQIQIPLRLSYIKNNFSLRLNYEKNTFYFYIYFIY